MTKQTKSTTIDRRAELLAELFLQDLEAEFVAQAAMTDFVFDFFIGFPNPEGGINTFAVEVKSTERPINGSFAIPANVYRRLAHSNIPVLLLVIDVKDNVIYYAWPGDHPDLTGLNSVKIPVVRVDSGTKQTLIDRMAS
jgi:hypothetical protein